MKMKCDFLICIIFWYINWTNAQILHTIDAKWNVTYNESTDRNSSIIFRFPVEKEGSVARVLVNSSQSTLSNPLLVVFRERKSILSLQVPINIQNYEYYQVGRTLCPFSGSESEYMEVEFNSFYPVLFNFRAFIVDDFHLLLGETRLVTASASQPVYLEYQIPHDIDSVVVHIDSESSICMTVSIQKAGCPVFDLTNNVISTGTHQSMTKSASIAVQRLEMPRFYVIFVVNPNDNICKELQEIVPIKPREAEIRRKMFNVTIESASSDVDYILPISVILTVIGLIYLIAIVYMVFDNRAEVQYLNQSYTIFENADHTEANRLRVQEELMRNDRDLADYDTLPDVHEKLVKRAKRKLTVADMALKTFKQREKKYKIYWVTILTVGLFYGLPVVQLVLTWQNAVRISGDQDLCWYNFRCARPFFGFLAFNNIISNCGYILLGLLLIVINKRRELRYIHFTSMIPRLETECGIPQHGGLMTSLGISVMLEGILSASYHICPSSSNYQFDTSFMYVIGMLGMLKIYQLRHPDVNANAHVAFAVVAAFILIAMCGVYLHNLAFWVIFSVIYMFTVLAVSIEFYFKGIWKFNFKEQWNTIKYSYYSSRRCSCLVPTYAGRFIILFIANLINLSFLIYGVTNKPKDFASFLLLPFIANLFLYLCYYICMKIGYREKIHPRSWVLLVLALTFWFIAGYFFLNAVSDWSKTPAKSRELNRPCIFLKFYDNHDIWHFFSSLAIFISFSLINRIDDDLMFVPRDEIIVF